MFWGLVACSATICTNRVRAFWYSSNTGERGKVEQPPPLPPIPTPAPSRRGARPQLPTLQHLALAHGAVRGVHSPRPLGPRLTALCTHAPGQPTGTGTQPSLGNCRARAWRHNQDRRTADRSPGTRGLTSRSVWCHFPADWVRDAGVRLEDAVGTYAPHREPQGPRLHPGPGAGGWPLRDLMSVPIDRVIRSIQEWLHNLTLLWVPAPGSLTYLTFLISEFLEGHSNCVHTLNYNMWTAIRTPKESMENREGEKW